MILIFFLKRVRTSEIIRKPQVTASTAKLFLFYESFPIIQNFARICSTSSYKSWVLQLWTDKIKLFPDSMDNLLFVYSQKKWSCFRKSTGWKIFYYMPARISQMCMRICIFLFQKNIRTNKKISTGKVIRTNLATFFRSKK